MKDLFFASSTMLVARHTSLPRCGIDFLLLSADEAGYNALLDDPLNAIAALASLSDRSQCHVGFLPLLTLLLIASPVLCIRCLPVICFQLWFAFRTAARRQHEWEERESAHR